MNLFHISNRVFHKNEPPPVQNATAGVKRADDIRPCGINKGAFVRPKGFPLEGEAVSEAD